MIEDYPYARMDFCGDPELVLHDGERWGTIGKIKIFLSFSSFKIYNSFVFSM